MKHVKKVSGWIIGYDPGGNGKQGVACILVQDNVVTKAKVTHTRTVDAALSKVNEIVEKGPVIGLGVDTLTEWCCGESGYRNADRILQAKYPQAIDSRVKKQVISSNGLRGAMSVNGMAFILLMKRRFPEILVTETHPKVLYKALTDKVYDWALYSGNMQTWINDRLGFIGENALNLTNDDQFDALISAYACLQGMKGNWSRDLHSKVLPMDMPENLERRATTEDPATRVRPAGKTKFFWPG